MVSLPAAASPQLVILGAELVDLRCEVVCLGLQLLHLADVPHMLGWTWEKGWLVIFVGTPRVFDCQNKGDRFRGPNP